LKHSRIFRELSNGLQIGTGLVPRPHSDDFANAASRILAAAWSLLANRWP
jgi:hypothetical protein